MRSCLGNGAGVALGAQAALLYALKVLQLCWCRCVRSMSAAASCAGRCRSRSTRDVGYARVRLVLRLLLLLMMMCMMMLVMVQRGAGSIVANLLGQRLTAPTQSGAQIIGDFCLGQQLLEDLRKREMVHSFILTSQGARTCVTLSLLAAEASTKPFSQSTVTTDSVVAYSTCM